MADRNDPFRVKLGPSAGQPPAKAGRQAEEIAKPCDCGGKAMGGNGFHYPGGPGCRKGAKTTGAPGVFVGSTQKTAQWGLLGTSDKTRVGLDLDGCNTVALLGVQGGGKSYTLGVIAEMATLQLPGINHLPKPLCTIMFHYDQSESYEPEFLSALRKNTRKSDVTQLADEYGATPAALADVVLLVPETKVEHRREQYQDLGIQVEPIKFDPSELKGMGWKILMGAYGNDALYLRQLGAILSRIRNDISLDSLRAEITDAGLSRSIEQLALDRINLAEPFILEGRGRSPRRPKPIERPAAPADELDEGEPPIVAETERQAAEKETELAGEAPRGIGTLLKAGRTIIVDLRDMYMEKAKALELIVVMMDVFGAAERDKYGRTDFNRLFVLDEAHQYIDEEELVAQLIGTVRKMRHLGMTIVLASQDPPSIHKTIIELSTVVILHRMTSPAWLKHLRGAIYALEEVSEKDLAELGPGEAFVWAQKTNDRRFNIRPQRIQIRPRCTAHGGDTKTAVQDD